MDGAATQGVIALRPSARTREIQGVKVRVFGPKAGGRFGVALCEAKGVDINEDDPFAKKMLGNSNFLLSRQLTCVRHATINALDLFPL